LSVQVIAGVSESVACGALTRDVRLPATAPVLVCHLVGSNSKLPELFNFADGRVNIGIGISSRSNLSTVANESGSLPTFFLYCDFMSDPIC
jgi:hypothetical protein